jgi:hypothetical protein
MRVRVFIQFTDSRWLSSDVDESQRVSSVDLKSFIQRMSQASSYGDGIMLEIALAKYKRPICIVSKDFVNSSIFLSNPQVDKAQCMFLGYTGSNHYFSILPWPTIYASVPQAAVSVTGSSVSLPAAAYVGLPAAPVSLVSATPTSSVRAATAKNTNVAMNSVPSSVELEPVEFYQGLPVDIDRLLKMCPELARKKEKDKGRTRILITCNVCYNFEDAARKASLTGSVPYASSIGVRTEGQLGAKRLIAHLKSKAHRAALDMQQLQTQFHRQSDKHPWLHILKKHRVEETAHLIRLAMDCYNDTMCETVSGFSWPSRSLTTLQSDRLVHQFSQDWDCVFQPFQPTPSEMHYRDQSVYCEMLSCVADVCRSRVIQELHDCDAMGIQIDGSCDRQQLSIKFVTARIITNGVICTRFLGAMEPTERGASGLLEALGRSLEQPADPSTLRFKDQSDDDVNDTQTDDTGRNDLLADVKMPDFKAPIFHKVLSLSTDGEAANTGSNAGLWRKLTDELGRFILCIWCVCHRSDLAFHDLTESVPEMKIWYSQVKKSTVISRFLRFVESPSKQNAHLLT